MSKLIRSLSFSIVVFPVIACAQFQVPDSAFAARLNLIVPAAMSGNVLDITHPSVLGLTTMNVHSAGIADLDGLQHFTGLHYLNCGVNQLTSLPSLPIGLTDLSCLNNQITFLPQLPPGLDKLECSTNQLTSLPILPSALTWLECRYNQLTSLPPLPSTLTLLNCGGNQIHQIGPLPNGLTVLICAVNPISCLPPLPNSVERIHCFQTYVQCLPNVPSSYNAGLSSLGFTLNICSSTSPCFANPLGRQVALKVFLDGPFDQNSGLMNDDLRVAGLVPLSEPYSLLGYVPVTAGPTAMLSSAILNTNGPNAIVDWVIVELRHSNNPGLVLASRYALLQRDGDVVEVNGVGPVIFDATSPSYRIAVRHRNHLGACTGSSVNLITAPGMVDLTTPSTTTWGTGARRDLNGTTVLWCGNVNFNDQVSYTGSMNDRDPILVAIGGLILTSTAPGYLSTDANLDGVTKYVGNANDRDRILITIGGLDPTAVRQEQLP